MTGPSQASDLGKARSGLEFRRLRTGDLAEDEQEIAAVIAKAQGRQVIECQRRVQRSPVSGIN